jgi:outer membrane protein OmpA-like peptidoglycan-associated protein
VNEEGNMPNRLIHVMLVVCALLAAGVTFGQTPAPQAYISTAEEALRRAEAAGSPIYATELYNEAMNRLGAAKTSVASDATTARLRATEAFHAARAAEAAARLTQAVTEARNLTADIQRFGGTVSVTVPEVQVAAFGAREASMDHVNAAQAAIDRAKAAGADRNPIAIDTLQVVDPGRRQAALLEMMPVANPITEAEKLLRTARGLRSERDHKDTAIHLSFVAEMMARRAEYLARMSDPERVMPGLRLERTRLAQAAAAAEADAERRRRESAEQQAAQLRAQLENEQATRQMQAQELATARAQLAEREQMLQTQLEADRQARIQAEARLDELRTNYQSALARAGSQSEVETLRRQVEDQQLALQNVRDREVRSEESMRAEIDRLQQALADERQRGQVVTQREQELASREAELEKMRQEREQNEQRRAEMERQHQAALAQLQQQVQQTQTELQQAREQLAARDAQDRERTERMQRALAEIAETRSDARGFILTLPGLFFDTGKATLKTGARNVLNRVAEQLMQNPEVTIVVEGHTDSVGSEESNQTLSEQRASAVREYLTGRGVPAARVSTVGRGEGAPIATNDTAAGRQQNRRVELVFAQ